MSKRSDTAQFRKDGNLSFLNGVNSAVPPSDIDRASVAFAVNATFRSGPASPRPGLKKRDLTFSGTSMGPFLNGLFQHAAFFDGSGQPMLLSSQGGRQFKINLSNFTVQEITPQEAWSTTTTAGFSIPAVNGTVAVLVASTVNMYTGLPSFSIGGYPLTLVSIDSGTQITVSNSVLANVGAAVGSPVAVTFSTFDINSPVLNKAWSEQAENYWILQDNQSLPIIFDGASARRSNPSKSEVPVGNVMCYTQGRLAVALPDRQSFRIGDIVFGKGNRSDMLQFTENSYLNEGGDFVARVFGAPSNVGPILSMKAGAQSDTQLGQGPMIVGTPYSVFTVNLPFDRTTWKNLQNALQTVNPIIGPLGQDNTVLVNTDLWYRGVDGVRSYKMAWRQFQDWGNTPMSAELNNTLTFDTPFLLEYGSGVLFDNRLLMTISPVKTSHGVVHRGLVALDFNLVSTIKQKAAPAWEGVWSGLRILKIIKGMVNRQERCFIYALNCNNQIELWEMIPGNKTDNGDPITWSLDLPSYNCGDSDGFKRLETGRLIIDELTGRLDYRVKYRTDQSPCWQDWDSGFRCSTVSDCGPFDCTGPQPYRPQERTPIRLHMPPDDFDPISGSKFRCGYEMQPRVEFTGWGMLRQFRIFCLDQPEILGVEKRDAV